MQTRLQETIDHLRHDIGRVDEPQLKAMFETSAEVLTGLKKASSVADLKFLPFLPHLRERNFKSKATLESYTC